MIELISIHIPKTGGQSLFKVLQNNYGDALGQKGRKRNLINNDKYIYSAKNVSGNGIKALHGHFKINQVKNLIETYNPKVITWLRDPVDRVISNYYYFMWRIRNNRTSVDQLDKINFGLMDYANLDHSKNRIMSFTEGFELEEFYFIGFFNNISSDIQNLSELLNWKVVNSVPHKNNINSFKYNNNCKTQYSEISNAIRNEIAYLNKYDIELYEHALNLRKDDQRFKNSKFKF